MPENIDTLLKQAQQLEKQQNYEQLSSLYRKIATYYHKQKDKAKNEEYIAKSKAAKEKLPDKEIQINQSVEEVLSKIREIPDSKEKYVYLEEFREKHPKFVPIYFELGNLALILNYYDKARKWFEYYLTICDRNERKNNSYAYSNLANIVSNDYFAEYDLAKKYYEKAIELAPNNWEIRNNLASLLMNDYFKEYDLAKEMFENLFKINPEHVIAINLTNLLSNDYFKEYDLAKIYYEKALELKPNNVGSQDKSALNTRKYKTY